MARKVLTDGGTDGTLIGQSATDLLGFYGLATSIAQPTVATIITTGATETATITLLRSIRLALINLGLVTTA